MKGRRIRSWLELFTTLLVSMLSVTTSEAQVQYVFGISNRMTEPEQRTTVSMIIKASMGAEPGDRIRVINALDQELIAEYVIPKSRTDRLRLKKIAPHLARVSKHLRSSGGFATTDGGIHLPDLMDTVGMMSGDGFSQTRVLVCGSMTFSAGTDRRFHFGPGSVPSDGSALAKVADTPLGTEGRRDHSRTRIDVYDMRPIQDDRERHAVERWWTVWAAELGVKITSWQTDDTIAVQNLLRELDGAHKEFEIDRNDRAIEIRRVEAGPSGPPVDLTPELSNAADSIPSPRDGGLSIGAVWLSQGENTDVDLWVRPRAGAEELSYRRKSTPEGKYLRDVQNSAEVTEARAWMAVWEAVEIGRADLDELEIWVNLFRNPDREPVRGFVRVLHQNDFRDLPFTLTGPGDQAAGVSERTGSASWLRIWPTPER